MTNAGAGTVSRKARLTVINPPQFLRAPPDKTVRAGTTVTLSVQLAPDPAPEKTFQWFKDGDEIPGATNKRLVLANVQATDAGNYYCVATSIGGSASSWGSQLTVLDNTFAQ